MNMLGAASLGIGAVFLILYLRIQQKEIAALIGIGTLIVLFTAAITRAAEILDSVLTAAAISAYGETVHILVKALGVAFAAQITADICREAGEAAVGTQVELFAKTEIVLLSLPLAEELLRIAERMLK